MNTQLLARLRETGAVRVGGPFNLASGGVSDHYFDVKRLLLDPEGLSLTAGLVVDLLAKGYPDVTAIGGPELGAVPLVGAALARWHAAAPDARAMTGFVVRKAPKAHGTGQRIEGRLESGALPQLTALVEDVTTTARSVIEGMEQVEAAGARVVVVFVVVNRGGNLARKAVEDRGAKFVPLLDSEAVLKFVRG